MVCATRVAHGEYDRFLSHACHAPRLCRNRPDGVPVSTNSRQGESAAQASSLLGVVPGWLLGTRGRFSIFCLITLGIMLGGCGGSGSSPSTPIGASMGWFNAINAQSPSLARSYFTPGARSMMDWGPASEWSTFTNIRCKKLSATRTRSEVSCTFHESPSRTEGNPVSYWSIELVRSGRRWLIDNYGQP